MTQVAENTGALAVPQIGGQVGPVFLDDLDVEQIVVEAAPNQCATALIVLNDPDEKYFSQCTPDDFISLVWGFADDGVLDDALFAGRITPESKHGTRWRIHAVDHGIGLFRTRLSYHFKNAVVGQVVPALIPEGTPVGSFDPCGAIIADLPLIQHHTADVLAMLKTRHDLGTDAYDWWMDRGVYFCWKKRDYKQAPVQKFTWGLSALDAHPLAAGGVWIKSQGVHVWHSQMIVYDDGVSANSYYVERVKHYRTEKGAHYSELWCSVPGI